MEYEPGWSKMKSSAILILFISYAASFSAIQRPKAKFMYTEITKTRRSTYLPGSQVTLFNYVIVEKVVDDEVVGKRRSLGRRLP